MKRRWLPAACVAFVISAWVSGCASPLAPASAIPSTPTAVQLAVGPPLRILFIGNSHTYTNNLPDMFARLAAAGGHPVHTDMSAKAGYLLHEHVSDQDTEDKLGGTSWDLVVLQENSNVPRDPSKVTEHMQPAVSGLAERVTDLGADTILLMTWAEPWLLVEGDWEGFLAEQESIAAAFRTIAADLGARVAPAGDAFAHALEARPELFLWQDDRIHLNQRGTYLAACVLYAEIYGASPEGLSYWASLSQDTADYLQAVAAVTVASISE